GRDVQVMEDALDGAGGPDAAASGLAGQVAVHGEVGEVGPRLTRPGERDGVDVGGVGVLQDGAPAGAHDLQSGAGRYGQGGAKVERSVEQMDGPLAGG